jgi:hypothetical protein
MMKLVDWFRDRIWPAPVAPFVTLIAASMDRYGDEFEIEPVYNGVGQLLTVKVRLAPDAFARVEQRPDIYDADFRNLVLNGVGVTLDMVGGKTAITTYYFDEIALNWRETRVMLRALGEILPLHELAGGPLLHPEVQP